VLFFVNEPKQETGLLAVPVDDQIVDAALDWTMDQVEDLRKTVLAFTADPTAVDGGSLLSQGLPIGDSIDQDLKAQCTGRGQRFDCTEYTTSPGSGPGKVKRDVNRSPSAATRQRDAGRDRTSGTWTYT
jgi:hypothetical protein